MGTKSDVSQIIHKFADDISYGKYGDDVDGAAFWEDWDELMEELYVFVPDPNAE